MITWKFHHAARTESTNLDARMGAPFEVFVADEQTAGRGRLSHVWFSPPGLNLYFSVVLPVGSLGPAEVATLPLVIGLAVCEAVGRLLSGRADAGCALKWPNDVLVGGKKLCGILCERHGDNVIAGVGLNVNVRHVPPDLADRMTSLSLESGHTSDRVVVLSRILEVVGSLHEGWLRFGFRQFTPRLGHYDFLKGKNVSVVQTDHDEHPLCGLCDGIQPDGTLLVGGKTVFAGEAHVTCF